MSSNEEFQNELPSAVQAQVDRANSYFEAKDPEGAEQASSTPEPGQDVLAGAPATPADKGETYWKDRFQTVQGKYDAEVPRLNSEVRNLEAKINDLNNLIATIQSPPKPEEAERPERVIDPEKFSDYGPEFSELAEEVRELRTTKAELLSELKAMKADVGMVKAGQKEASTDKFFKQLDDVIPGWRSIDDSEEWKDWLQGRDPELDEARYDILVRNFQRSNLNGVKSMFERYAAFAGIRFGQNGNGGHQQIPTGRQALERRIEPTKTGTANEPPKGSRTWTSAEVRKFYADRVRDPNAMSEDQAAAIEKDIFAAQKEGRIRG